MMREWFNVAPGDSLVREDEDGTIVAVVGDPTPDVVRLPTELGGQVACVIRADIAPCPCGCGDVRRIVTDAPAPDHGVVASLECTTTSRFFWMRVDKPIEAS